MEKIQEILWKITEKEEYQKLKKIVTVFFAVCLFGYVVCLEAQQTTMPPEPFAAAAAALFQPLLWLAALRVCFEIRNYKSLLAAGVLALNYLLVYRSVGYRFLSFYALIVIGTVGIEYRRLLKAHTVVMGLVLLTAVTSAFAGCTENLVYLYGDNKLRDSFGICYPTDFASCLFYLLLFFWIAWKKLPSWVSLILCIPFVWIARKFAISDTGVICGGLFLCVLLIFLYAEKTGKQKLIPERAEEIMNKILIFAFPLCSALMLILLLLYISGTGFGQWMNSFLSGRLGLAYRSFQENGIQIFGKPITQIGGGYSTFHNTGYNFVDSTYPLILIRYGWVLFLVTAFFWVRVTWLAVREKDYRLAFGMGFIAFHSLSEHHFMEINYNILLAMPLADYTVRGMENRGEERKADGKTAAGKAAGEKAGAGEEQDEKRIYGVISALAVAALTVLTEPLWMAYLRTVCGWCRMRGKEYESLLAVGITAGAAALAAFLAFAVWETAWSIRKKTRNRKAYGMLAAALALCVLGILGGRTAEDRIAADCAQLLEKDAPAVHLIVGHAEGTVCVDELPVPYRQAFSEIKYPVFMGEDLSRYRNMTVIVPRTRDYNCFQRRDFLYTAISDESSIYTNDPGVIKALEEAGYSLKDHYDEIRYIELPLQTSPEADLRAGSYQIRFVLQAELSEEISQFAKVFIVGNYGHDVLVDWMLDSRVLDEDGKVDWKMRLVLPKDTQGVKFYLLPENGASLDVKEVSYQMTRLIRKR